MTDLALCRSDVTGDQRERRAHQERRREQHDDRQHEAHDGQCKRATSDAVRSAREDVRQRPHQRGAEHGERTDAQFDKRVVSEQVRSAAGPTPAEETAEREAPHEHDEHDADRVDGHAEHADEHPHPDDLVSEAADARDQEDQREEGVKTKATHPRSRAEVTEH